MDDKKVVDWTIISCFYCGVCGPGWIGKAMG